MKLLKNRKFAITICVVIVIAATALAVLRDMNRTGNDTGAVVPATPPVNQPDGSFFITDEAGVLSTVTHQDIISANRDLMELCQGAQIVIVTISYLDDGMYADEYAMQLFNDRGVAGNGMLLLLVTEEYAGWLIVGPHISGAFTDRMANQYLDTYFWPDVDTRNYDTAVRKISDGLFSWYAGYYNINNNSHYAYDTSDQWISAVVFLVIFVMLIAIVIIMSAGSDRRRHRMYYTHMGMPIPTYHWWYMWGPRPYRTWYHTHHHHNNWRGPRGPRGPGGGGFGGGGRSGGGFGGGGRR